MVTEALRGPDTEKLKTLVLDRWRAGGGETLVKAMPKGLPPDETRAVGYCTSLKFIVGRTPEEMERILGFASGSPLQNGADVYRVDPLPSADQFELRGYSQLPDGKPQIGGKIENPLFPPGLGAPQWKLSGYPQSGLRWLATVLTGQPFTCRDDSLPTGLGAFIAE